MARSARVAGRYGGDARLGALLRQAGSSYDPEGVRSLIGGVLAAPPGPEPAAWVALVAPQVSPELKAELLALADEVAVAPRPAPMPRNAGGCGYRCRWCFRTRTGRSTRARPWERSLRSR